MKEPLQCVKSKAAKKEGNERGKLVRIRIIRITTHAEGRREKKATANGLRTEMAEFRGV
jgi:hypothetical protein